MEVIEVRSRERCQLIDITEDVERIVSKKGIEEGLLVLYVPHTTAAIIINEGYDPSVAKDMLRTLEKLIPMDGGYEHLEGNSDAHIKASILGQSVCLLVENGKIILGKWQRVFLFEGDGPRKREIFVKVLFNR